jgi:hypothetical protein
MSNIPVVSAVLQRDFLRMLRQSFSNWHSCGWSILLECCWEVWQRVNVRKNIQHLKDNVSIYGFSFKHIVIQRDRSGVQHFNLIVFNHIM